MTPNWGEGFWKLGLASSLAVGGAIAEPFDCALAQIAPDGTLGAESSVVTPTNVNGVPSNQIDGGATRGANLFHSFDEFSVPTGGEAFFNNALDIQNIISRVTGASISNIDGLLRANGTANLFLLNPNGILFGPNATLNIGGSFVGSTASSLNFADGTQFSATAHPTTPLLTISVPIGLQYGGTAGSILNQSRATNSSRQRVGLQVPSGRTLALVGGEVRFDGGRLEAPGGRIELGGVSGSGTVGLSVNQDALGLSFPDDVARADVYLTNRAAVNVAASNGGSITITARDINIAGGSVLRTGIERGLGSPGAQAGDITLNATGAITITNGFISSNVRTGAVGKGGNIDITSGSLSVTNGAQLNASTSGQGDAGSVNTNARNTVSFDGGSAAFSSVEPGGVGNGGSVNITTESLAVTNDSRLISSTYGQGDAGSMTITARDTVSFDGRSAAFSSVQPGGVGNGGSVNITTGSLAVTNDSQLISGTRGQGDAGSMTITARDTVSFDGGGDAFSTVESGAVGNSRGINITTGSLALTNGAQLSVGTRGQGDAGSMTITARDTVSFDGRSYAFSSVVPGAVGNGGGINITTGSLSVTNGAGLLAQTEGQGNAGSVTIRATDTVSFDGVGSNGFFSAAFSTVESGAVGNGGGINITTGSLSVTNGAGLTASTSGQGDGGNITLNANTMDAVNGGQVITTSRSSGKAGNITLNVTDSVTLAGSDLTYNAARLAQFGEEVVDGVGPASGLFGNTSETSTNQGGDLKITTGQLIVRDGAEVSVSSEGTGDAGNLQVQARSIRLDNKASLRSDTKAGQGNIILDSKDLVLRLSSNITTNATGTATGGNITIDTGVIAALENSDISANAQEARGGRVIIDAQGIFGTEFQQEPTSASDITATSELGPEFSGTVEINTPDVDPSRGLVNLPTQPIDTEVVQACQPGGSQQQSEFVVTGRGGLPPNPSDPLNSDAVWIDLDSTTQLAENRTRSKVATQPTNSTPEQIVEATGWVINDKGSVVLIASAPTATPHSPGLTPANCHVP